jgi:Kdo2-lipid IVA lauroyltransferase/acyltransferase
MKTLKHHIEFWLLKLLFTAFRALPLDVASYAGGFMARCIGPLLRAHKTAKINLAQVFPDMPREERYQVIRAMWDNLGRVAGELPHLPGTELISRVKVVGEENFPAPGQPALFFSAHFGNWELAHPTAFRHGLPIVAIYREANNPAVDAFVTAIRATHADDMIPKGAKHSIRIIRAIKARKPVAMLIDQKMNEGIAVPFFGRPAMTAPAIAELSLRYDLAIVPARIMRTHGAHFEATIFPPIHPEKTGDTQADVLALMTRINSMLEQWICEKPAQWFWVHQRWPKA